MAQKADMCYLNCDGYLSRWYWLPSCRRCCEHAAVRGQDWQSVLAACPLSQSLNVRQVRFKATAALKHTMVWLRLLNVGGIRTFMRCRGSGTEVLKQEGSRRHAQDNPSKCAQSMSSKLSFVALRVLAACTVRTTLNKCWSRA